jgi:CDP-6-deoxy-D-xylo-4-hexulose-3-dehydrase
MKLDSNLSGLVKSLAHRAYSELHSKKDFVAGVTHVPVTGKVFDESELEAAITSSIEFWLTSGPHTKDFESALAKRVGVRNAFMVNSGSSANLIALSALTSVSLGERQIKPGDEVITVAAGFPTTVTPIIQNALLPVYVDVSLGTYSANFDQVEEAISPKTKAIMMAHTLGNPFDLERVTALCKQHNLWLIEDACDALGGTFQNQQLGSFGDLATLSFYPAHHITTGEGGAVLTKGVRLKPIVESFRDWGRDCWCDPGCDNTCGKRFSFKLGDLPEGYDHKYTYSHLGYNLKSGDIQAAIGNAQLSKVDEFVKIRRRNHSRLLNGLADLQDHFILPVATEGSQPSWFGFAITLKDQSVITRNELIQKLNDRNIGTRLMFGGNLLRQPAFVDTPRRVIGSLPNTNHITENTFWIGVWPGLTEPMIDYMIESLHEILKGSQK